MTSIAEPETAVKTVIDCAESAWDEYGDTGLGSFAAEYWRDLADAGRELIRPLLVEAWKQRGYEARLVDPATFDATPTSVDEPADEVFWAVRKEAAAMVDDEALLTATDLFTEYRDFCET